MALEMSRARSCGVLGGGVSGEFSVGSHSIVTVGHLKGPSGWRVENGLEWDEGETG